MKEAIVLCGGFGTRLRSVITDMPKPLAPVAGKAFLEILLESLSRSKIKRVVLATGYLGEMIFQRIGNNFAGLEVEYSRETQPMGTGGALTLALQRCASEQIYVTNGDTFVDFSMDELRIFLEANNSPVIVGASVPDTGRFGRVQLMGNKVIGFDEKGTAGPGTINAGAYVFEKHAFLAAAPSKPFSLEKEYLVPQSAKGLLSCFVSSGLFLDIGTPEDYLLAQDLLSPERLVL